MASLSPYPVWQILDDDGIPIPGAKLYTYAAGTDTPKATYTDYSGGHEEANPIVADSAGRLSVWLGSGAYKFILKDADDVTIWTRDNIYASDFSGSGTIIVVETIAALRALTARYNIVIVLGYWEKYDNGGGMFYWQSNSTETDNDGVYIKPTDNPATGRYVRQYQGRNINVRWFGAKGNGTYDDYNAIVKAYNYTYALNFDGNLLIPAGDFYVSDSLVLSGLSTILEPFGNIKYPEGKAPTINPILYQHDETLHFERSITQEDFPTIPENLLLNDRMFQGNGNMNRVFRSLLRGLKLENSGDLSIKINPGYAGMSNKNFIAGLREEDTSFTKKLDATWTDGTNQGGRASGCGLDAGTWFHVFMVANFKGEVDFGFDTDITAANLLDDCDYKFPFYRRIGSVYYYEYSEGLYKIASFEQIGDEFIIKDYNLEAFDVNDTATHTGIISFTPKGFKTRITSGMYAFAKAFNVWIHGEHVAYYVAVDERRQIILDVNEDGEFDYSAVDTGSNVSLKVLISSYTDTRGKND